MIKGTTKVWIDVDTGVDDAHALLLALRSPELFVAGISCVAGNADVDTVLASTLKVCDAAGARPDLPIARGCERPLVEPTHFCFEIHGDDSLGDLDPPLPPSTRKVSSKHATELLLETLTESSEKVTILALAPLTNIAKAIRSDPTTMRAKVDRIVWMGGAVASGGNATSWAEANAFYDPEAAHIVLSAGIPMLMYTWDVYLKVDINKEDLNAMGLREENSLVHTSSDYCLEQGAKFRDGASKLGARLLHRDMRHFNMSSAQIGDAGAVAALLMPSAVKTRHLHVAVEMTGEHTRGMTVCDLREFVCDPDRPMKSKNAHVCVDVDGARIAALYIARVLRPPPESPYATAAAHLSSTSIDKESPTLPPAPSPIDYTQFSTPYNLQGNHAEENEGFPLRAAIQLSMAAVAAWAYRGFGGGLIAWIGRQTGRLAIDD